MILTIILWVLTLAAIAALFKAPGSMKTKKPKIARIVFGVLAAVFLLMALSVKQVGVGNILLVKEWGRAVGTKEPGINFIMPVVQSTENYQTRTRQIDMEFQAYSLDAQTMNVLFAVQYSVDPTRVVEIATKYGSQDSLEVKIARVIEERAKVVFSSKSAMRIIETREALSAQLLEAMMPLNSEYCIFITVAVASDISFSDAFETAVENKMLAEQAKLQAEYDKEKAIIKSEEQLEVAKRAADAAIAKANGDAESLTIMQDAWSALSQPVKDAMLRQQFYEKWDGELPQVMSDGSMIYDIGGSPTTTP
jgi:regulator of protease activity HflC (stomatin/prohibitin superfamily)